MRTNNYISPDMDVINIDVEGTICTSPGTQEIGFGDGEWSSDWDQ